MDYMIQIFSYGSPAVVRVQYPANNATVYEIEYRVHSEVGLGERVRVVQRTHPSVAICLQTIVID